MHDDEVKRLLAEGKTVRARQLMGEAGHDGRSRRMIGPLVGFGFLTILLAVAVALIYGMSFLGLLVLRGIQPLLDAVTPRFWVVLLSPMGLVAVGLLIIVVGLPRTRRVRRPARWRAGVIALGLAFSTFWPLQFLAARIDVSFPEFRTALHLLAGFVSICLLTGGLELIRMANNTGEDDSWEFLN